MMTPTTLAFDRGPARASPRWMVYYYLVQFCCQLALLTSVLSTFRVFFRTAAFVMSLVALGATAWTRPLLRHKASGVGVGAIVILVLQALNPGTSSAIGALAAIALYVSILGPLFWVPRLEIDTAWFRRVVLMLWGFQALSALVGALQVYFPGTFQPSVSALLDDNYVSSLHITLANGQRILRPTGLTDTPGGAAGAGTYTILLALGLLLDRPRLWLRGLLLTSILVGMFTLYICQIRSLVVMVAISILGFGLASALSGKTKNLALVGAIVGSLAVASFLAAVAVGGEDVTHRLATLTEGSPTEVYYTNRGIFLEHTLLDLLPQYPLGAGLARWGMISNYFSGDSRDLLYAEIQWTGWLLDGGIPLIVMYALLVAMTARSVWQLARATSGPSMQLSSWAAMLVGYDIGTIALTFNFPVFMSAFGLDFWLLNAALLTVAARIEQDAASSHHGNVSRSKMATSSSADDLLAIRS